LVNIDGMDGLGRLKQADQLKPSGESARSAEAPGEPQQAGDRAEFSYAAKQIAQLADKAAGFADVRREKVEAIRQSLEEGVYEVDPRFLAKAMVEFEDAFNP